MSEAFEHNGIVYTRHGGFWWIDFADDTPNVAVWGERSRENLIAKGEESRRDSASSWVSCAMESRYGGSALYSWVWENIGDETIAEYSVEDVLRHVESHLIVIYNYKTPNWVKDVYPYFPDFMRDSDYWYACRAFFDKWQECQAEYNPHYGMAI